MKIKYSDDKHVKVGQLKPGDCFMYNGELFITTMNYDYRKRVVSCINLHSGIDIYMANEDVVLKVNATVTVEE